MRVLGIDFGLRRVGLALSDPSGVLARPWRVIERDGDDSALAVELAREIAALADGEDGLVAVVVGRPARLDGATTEMTARVEAFATVLGGLVTVPVALEDERLSSREAEARLALRERDWRKRKAKLDAAAAAVVLQDYLDRSSPPGPRPAEGDLP